MQQDIVLQSVCAMQDSVPIVFTMDTQAITSLAVSVANRTLVKPPEVMNFEMLFHVAHVYGHFRTEQALNALCAPCVLLSVLWHKLVEFKLFLVRLHVCSPMIVGCWAGKASEFYRNSLLELRQVVNFPHMKVKVGCGWEDGVTYLTRGFAFVNTQMVLKGLFVGKWLETNITGKLRFVLPGRTPGVTWKQSRFR